MGRVLACVTLRGDVCGVMHCLPFAELLSCTIAAAGIMHALVVLSLNASCILRELAPRSG